MSEYEMEPVPGLPGNLPDGEHIIWQGAPDWKQMFGSALHVRLLVGYFALVAGWMTVDARMTGAIIVVLLGAVVLAMCAGFAWGVGRTSLYTLTNKRVVLRIGVALNTCINLPLREIESANLKMLSNGHGNIVLSLKGLPQLGYVLLWPHARALRIVRPQPMLRAVPDAQVVAQLLFKATQKIQPIAPAEAQPQRQADRPLVGAAA